MVQLTLFFFSVFLPFLMLINKYGFYSNVHVKSKWFGVFIMSQESMSGEMDSVHMAF